MYAEVLVEIFLEDKTFTYEIPNDINVYVGSLVKVPFQNRYLEGFVMAIHNNKPNYAVKKIMTTLLDKPVLNEEMITLGKYLSKKNLSSLISVYQSMLPKALKASYKTNISKKYQSIISLIDKNYIPKNDKQMTIISKLSNPCLKEELSKISSSSLKTLLKQGVLKEDKKEVYRLNSNSNISKENIILTQEQKEVINKINISKNNIYLLHGVTGSGKTEVYLNIIEKIIKIGKEAIFLVPEISLTPQLTKKVINRFGNLVAIMHSKLSDGERYDEYRKVLNNEVKIVIGARSAVFSPFTNLGLIVIDEEHSETYKQENNPHYHAIEVAIKRCKYHDIPLILGSATPSLESYTRAKMDIYKLLELPNRINKNMPKTILVDMHKEIRLKNRVISKILDEKIKERLQKKEQVLILLNRRGYTTTINCHDCGYTDNCPNCDIPLIYHKTTNKMMCHYCGYQKSKLIKCPSCQSININEFGMGTQKLQELLATKYPDSKIVRMDLDTTKNKASHAKIIEDFYNQKYDIMIGTQMIAKGLNFPKVTLVGILNADASLNIPDFRSSERTYSLVEQTAGRSGRHDILGEVIIQGFNINHYALEYAAFNNYQSFYKKEMHIRKLLEYPPYINLSLIKIKSNDQIYLEKEALKIANFIKNKNINTLGPSYAMIPKINNIYTMQIILKYKDSKEVYKILEYLYKHYLKNNKIKLDIDISPVRF